MPYTYEQRRAIVSAHGLNPDEYDLGPDEQSFTPKPIQQSPTTTDVTTTDLPKPTSTPSPIASAGRSALESVLPTAAGLGTTAGILAAFPEPTMVTKVGALLAGIGASVLASKTQRKVVPENIQQNLFTRPEDYEVNPKSTIAGGFVPSALTLRPTLQDIPELVGGIKALPRALSVGGSALTSPQIEALLNAGMSVGPSGAMYAADVASGNREFKPSELALETLPGILMTHPTPLGRKMGFTSPSEMRAGLELAERARLAEATKPVVEPVENIPQQTAKQFGIVPEGATVTPKGKVISGKEAAEAVMNVPEGTTVSPELEKNLRRPFKSALESAQVIEEGLTPAKRSEEGFSKQTSEAQKEIDFYKAKAEEERKISADLARQEAEQLAIENENKRRQLNMAVGEKPAKAVERTVGRPEEQAGEELWQEVSHKKTGKFTSVEERTPVYKQEGAPFESSNKEIAEKPLTEAERIQEEYDKGLRHSEVSDLDLKAPVETLPAELRATLKRDIERIARSRRQKVEYVSSLKNKEGKEILGQYDPVSKTIKLNKRLYAGDTGPHEISHGRILDLLDSGSEKDRKLVLKGLEYADPQGRKFKTVEDFRSLGPEEQVALEERFTKSVGPEGYRQQLVDLYGNKREKFKEWLGQVGTHFKMKTGLADSDELASHFAARQRFDAPDYLRTEMSQGVGTKAAEGERNAEEETPKKEAPVVYKGYQEGIGKIKGFHLYNITEDAPGLVKGSTVIEKSIRDAGYEIPAAEKAKETPVTEEKPITPKEENTERNQEESDLKDTEIEQHKPSFLDHFFPSTTQKVRNLGGNTAKHVGDVADKYLATKSLHEGKYRNEIVAEITSYLKDVRDTVDQYGREMMLKGKSDIELLPEEQSLYDSIREYLKTVADENTVREIKKNPNYWPQILDSRVAHIWSKAPNSPEGKMYQKEWMAHAKEQVKKGRASYTDEQLKEIQRDYMAAIGSKGKEASFTFGALRKAAGLGLPESMQDNNLLSRFSRYGTRVAKDIAYNTTLENDPVMRYMFRLKDEKGQVLTEPPKLPSGEEVDDAIRGVEPMQNLEKALNEEYKGTDTPRINAAMRAVSSALLGTATGIRDIATAPLNVSVVIGPRNSDALIKGLSNWKEGAEKAFSTNARHIKMNELEFGSAAHPDTLTRWFSNLADGLRKYSGRESLEQASRVYTFNVGRLSAVAEFGRNDTAAQNWLKKYGKTVEGGIDKYFGKNIEEIPGSVIDEVAKGVVDRAQGTYDARGLPHFIMDGPLAPFFSLSRWSYEKAHVITQDVLKPAAQGNFIPLLSYTLGSFLTGGAIQKLNELMSSGKRGNEPTLSEAQAADSQQVRAVVNLLQLGSFAGMIGDLMKGSTELLSGHRMSGGLSFPLGDFVSETLGKNLSDYNAAIQAGEEPVSAGLGLVERILTDSVQSVRLASYATWRKDEIERKNAYRDVRLWQELTGRRTPDNDISRPNELIGKEAKDFKRAKTIDEGVALLPAALEKVIENSGGDVSKLLRGFKGLKANNYQTFPADPLEMVAYYEYLKKTQGEEEAAKRLGDYFQQKMVNSAKSSLVP